jgi:hypothetical protein
VRIGVPGIAAAQPVAATTPAPVIVSPAEVFEAVPGVQPEEL